MRVAAKSTRFVYFCALLFAGMFGASIVAVAQQDSQATAQRRTSLQTELLGEARRLNSEVMELYSEDRVQEAIPLARRALAIREDILGPDDPVTGEPPRVYRRLQPLRWSDPGTTDTSEL